MGRHLGELQRELNCVRNREEERDRRTELSLEAIEALIVAREEDSDRRFQKQAQENAERISKVLYGHFHRYKRHGTSPQTSPGVYMCLKFGRLHLPRSIVFQGGVSLKLAVHRKGGIFGLWTGDEREHAYACVALPNSEYSRAKTCINTFKHIEDRLDFHMKNPHTVLNVSGHIGTSYWMCHCTPRVRDNRDVIL